MVIISNTGLFKSKEGSRIGLLLKKPESNFSNGCVQQAIFLKQMLQKAGFECEYLSIEPTYTKIQDTNETVICIREHMNLGDYKLLIFVSLNLVSPENDGIIKAIKRNKPTCINLICGNVYILHQEEFVFGHHSILSRFVNDLYDEYWVLEMYPFMVEYIKLISNKPTHLLPYVWNDTVLTSYLTKNNLSIVPNAYEVNREKINLLIYEPNMSIHKTALIPLLICESYYKQYKHRVNKVFVFCGDKVIRLQNGEFVRGLELYKDNKLEAYPRMIMPATLSFIGKNNNCMNIVVSHNIMNNLNFLHLEMIANDIPIVHNCEPFKENGLYYDEQTTCSAIGLIEQARQDFYANDKYQECKHQILKKYHPNNLEKQEAYRMHIMRVSSLKPKDDTKVSVGNATELVKIMTKVGLFVSKQPKIDNILFYNGTGIVILFKDVARDLPLLKKTIQSLNTINNTLSVEIVFVEDQVDRKVIQDEVHPVGYSVEYLNLQIPATDHPNEYKTIVFSTFEKGIFVACGAIFTNTTPQALIEKYSENSLMFYPSFRTIKQMSEVERDIYNKMSFEFTNLPVKEDECLMDNSIITFNKKDTACLKVLGTVCEIMKLNAMVVLNTNLLDLLCKLNYGNKNSLIESPQSVLGVIHAEFDGYGILFDDIAMCYKEPPPAEQRHVVVGIKDANMEVKMSSENLLTFTGEAPAKKLPKALSSIIV